MYSASEQKRIFALSKDFLDKKINALDLDNLIEVLVFHEHRYAVLNDPMISDFEYDQLYKKLEQLESENPNNIRPDSPTQRVANDLSEKVEAVPHLTPMLSLDNSYNAEDLNDFDAQIKKHGNLEENVKIVYTVEPKFDGGSLALVYENDLLIRAATRGDGTRGERMTANAKSMKSIPLKALFSSLGIYKAEIRGEALIRKEVFDKMNAAREKEGLPVFANPRNAATGGLRMKDPNETGKRGIEAFMFQLSFAEDKNGEDLLPKFKSHFEQIELLGSLGFKIPIAEKKQCASIGEASKFCAMWQEKRESYPYEIDGMVVKVDSLELQAKCGFTQHHPRWAIAYKFKAKQATSELLDVDYQVGKVGSITPVAKIKPVSLAGVTVSSISLHNEEFISSKDIRIGDQVLVERAGDVIPYIVKSMADLRDGSEKAIVFPSSCPVCETTLVKEEKEAKWRCPNYTCTAQVIQRMAHHVSKDAMNIDGFGESIIERFLKEGWVQDVSDIYNLDYEKISTLEGFGEKSAKNLEAAISKAKKNPISRLLYSLSVHHLGKKASKLIAEQITHVMDLKNWEEENFTNIKDIGPVVAKNVQAFFKDPEALEMLEKMESYGVNFHQTEEDKPLEVSEDAVFYGKTILFTGSLQTMKRKEAQEMAALAGAKNISAVSSNLDILVVGEKAGSKLKKAEALGTVDIYTEEDFVALIQKTQA